MSVINSLKKNYIGIIIIFFSSVFTSVGQLLWKLSSGSILKFIIFGFICYAVGAVLMIVAFRFGSFSVLHPMMSFGYIFAIILGKFFLKENITTLQLCGVFIIILGVTFIGGGDE